ncbi:MAG: hypothetical protein GXY07_05745 [Candidatus Hydrogenedentes bacterium]|nr:hypothetical protein [Candidatus Hydrogenedentota bacterium]
METKDAVLEAILKHIREREGSSFLPCEEAFKIAADLSVDMHTIGRTCNINKIKIGQCQLGCFK